MPFNILGMPLFVDYTTSFYDSFSRIAFTPTTGSDKIDIEADVEEVPQQKLKLLDEFLLKTGAEKWAELIALTSSLGMIVSEGYMVYRYYWPEWANDTNRM